MLRNFFVYKMQCALSCPKSARKIRGFRETRACSSVRRSFKFRSNTDLFLNGTENLIFDHKIQKATLQLEAQNPRRILWWRLSNLQTFFSRTHVTHSSLMRDEPKEGLCRRLVRNPSPISGLKVNLNGFPGSFFQFWLVSRPPRKYVARI